MHLDIENVTTFVYRVLGCLGGSGGLALLVCFSESRGERLVASILFFKKCQKFLKDLHGPQISTTKN